MFKVNFIGGYIRKGGEKEKKRTSQHNKKKVLGLLTPKLTQAQIHESTSIYACIF